PTGVEMAGALAELSRRSLVREFRRIDTRTSRILLLEAGPGSPAAFAEKLAEKARAHLEEMGVTVRVGAAVTSVDPGGVTVNGSETIAADNVIWTAGVRGTRLGPSLSAPPPPPAFPKSWWSGPWWCGAGAESRSRRAPRRWRSSRASTWDAGSPRS